MQRAIQTTIMRGGTSKGIFLAASDLPAPGALRDAVILRIFGSPDPRQIDGLGGADTLTSKLAIIGPPSVPSADVDYTFGQVSFVEAKVDYGGNCGNISSAVGPYASFVQVDASEKQRVVRVHNTNTGALLQCTVQLSEGRAAVDGEVEIAGAARRSAATRGSVTGKLLPSGQLKESLQVPGDGPESVAEEVDVTLLDAGQPMVFMRATDLFKLQPEVASAGPKAQAEALKNDAALLRRVERIRGVAAVRMGIVEQWHLAEKESPYTPFVAAISPPASKDADFSSLCVFMQKIHQAYPVTGSVATAAAALLEGSIFPEAGLKPFPRSDDGCKALVSASAIPVERLGSYVELLEGAPPVMDVDAAVRLEPPELLRAAMVRSARCLMDGEAYIPWSAAEAVAAIAEKTPGMDLNARRGDPIATEELKALAPELGFQAAREATGKIYETLEKLKAAKQKNGDETQSFEVCSLSLQKQLLSLRRAHRAMIKFSDNGRMAEVAARKQTESEFQNFQTRKYESSVCRAAAGRCRYLETPQLEELRPLITGFQEKEQDSTAEAERATALTEMIQQELQKRISLEEELKALEEKKQLEQQKLTARVSLGKQLSAKISSLKRALEPLCSLLRGDDATKPEAAGNPGKGIPGMAGAMGEK
eukprot:s391_g25.t1